MKIYMFVVFVTQQLQRINKIAVFIHTLHQHIDEEQEEEQEE